MDTVLALLSICVLVGLFLWAGLKWWAWMAVAIMLVVGLFEGASELSAHRSMSQVFWRFTLDHPKKAVVVGLVLLVAFVGLVVHLMIKWLHR